MEQVAIGTEAAVVGHYFSLPAFCLSLPMDTGKKTDDCFVMCP